MRVLNFMIGSSVRKVIVNGRKFSLLTSELNFVPLTIDLDKLDESKDQIKKMGLDEKAIKELQGFDNEDDIAEDIIKDFKSMGWRLSSDTE